nr:unnamed protein product [Callosobruchus analis]
MELKLATEKKCTVAFKFIKGTSF